MAREQLVAVVAAVRAMSDDIEQRVRCGLAHLGVPVQRRRSSAGPAAAARSEARLVRSASPARSTLPLRNGRVGGSVGDTMHHIGEVSEAIGLSLRTIRYYEETGLAPPSGRTAGGFRLYTESDVARLRLIMVMKPLGFSLEEMRLVFDAIDALAAGGSSKELASHRDRLGMFVAVAAERCERLREQLDAAESFISMLQGQTRAARHS